MYNIENLTVKYRCRCRCRWRCRRRRRRCHLYLYARKTLTKPNFQLSSLICLINDVYVRPFRSQKLVAVDIWQFYFVIDVQQIEHLIGMNQVHGLNGGGVCIYCLLNQNYKIWNCVSWNGSQETLGSTICVT